jgi:prepilin-type N-terminal cleavage/methylation domain-containing protein
MDRRGVTLIELLVAMVLMGLLAAIVTKTVTGKSAAAMAVLKSDLRNLASAEEAYYSIYMSYSSSVEDLDFQGSKNVRMNLRSDATGWSAQTDHEMNPDFRCALYIGRSVEPYSPAIDEGLVACSPTVGGGGCNAS